MSARDVDTESEAGPSLVRPYTLVGGRTRAGSGAPIPVESVVVTGDDCSLEALVLEPAAIARMCRAPLSVAEVSARLGVPVGVTRVLVADLVSQGIVRVDLPPVAGEAGHERDLLERVLAGLEAL